MYTKLSKTGLAFIVCSLIACGGDENSASNTENSDTNISDDSDENSNDTIEEPDALSDILNDIIEEPDALFDTDIIEEPDALSDILNDTIEEPDALFDTDTAEEPDAENTNGFIVINEIVARSAETEDWIEFFNPSNANADVSNWSFRDSNPDHSFVFPPNTVINVGEYLIFEKDAPGSFGFGFGSNDEVYLFDDSDTLIDQTVWESGDAEENTSWGRYPNGSGDFETLLILTRGSENRNLVCNDGILDDDEFCEADNLNGETCRSQNYEEGQLACDSSCQAFDYSDCLSREDVLIRELDLQNQNVDPASLLEKYTRMAVSPFTFFRGTAHLFYYDLHAENYVENSPFSSENTNVWLQGDAHVYNFGSFDDSAGNIIYDLNDFDESTVASYLYDLSRIAVSILIVAEENDFSHSEQEDFLDLLVEDYLETLSDYVGNQDELTAFVDSENAFGLLDEFLEEVENAESREEMLQKWTENGEQLFDLEYEKLLAATPEEYAAISSSIAEYYPSLEDPFADDYFQVLDVARRIGAGTGSLGRPRYYVLIQGETDDPDDDRILDVKMQSRSAIFNYLSQAEQNVYRSHFPIGSDGCRVSTGNSALLFREDPHLGCLTFNENSFSVRERSPFKNSFDATTLTTQPRMEHFISQWAEILATGHARSDADFDENYISNDFETALTQLINDHEEFTAEIQNFAFAYHAQVQDDYDFFIEALDLQNLAIGLDISLNEIVCASDATEDWIELVNFGDSNIDLSGWTLTDDPDDINHLFLIPTGTLIAPNEHLVFIRNEENSFGFGLGNEDAVHLFTLYQAPVDLLEWENDQAPEGSSFGRIPDAIGEPQTIDTPTLGGTNIPN